MGFYGECPRCGDDLDLAYNPSTGEERLQCVDEECEWHEDE